MTTAPVTAPAQLARPIAPSRRQSSPERQRLSTAVLAAGTLLSLGSLFGPDWALRAGVAIALASAAISCGLAWRELYFTRRRHARDLLAVGRRHSADLRAEREHNADVLDSVSGRAQRWRREVDRQQTQIAGLRVQASALGNDLQSARRQLVRADGVIAGLRETVHERDVEIALLRSDTEQARVDRLEGAVDPESAGGDGFGGAERGGGEWGGGERIGGERGGAEVHDLPRRSLRPSRGEPDTGESSHAGDGPRVVEFPGDEPVLPNFEADRRRA